MFLNTLHIYLSHALKKNQYKFQYFCALAFEFRNSIVEKKRLQTFKMLIEENKICVAHVKYNLPMNISGMLL